MTRLIDAAFANTRVVMTALFVMIFFGIVSYNTIPREADPDIPAPFIIVTIPLPGVSPEDGERLLVRPTELQLQTIEGLKQMDSLAYDGAAQIVLEFVTTVDVKQAFLDVREAVDRAKTEYPTDAEEPIVREISMQSQFPILTVILHGDAPERALYQTARALKDRLESIHGVLDARLTGARDELLEVIVNPSTLEAFGLTEMEVVNAVTANNRLVTAGSINLEDGRFAVKAPGLVKSAQDLMATPVRTNADRIVTVGDIAEVRRTFSDRTGYAIFNGKPAIGVEITKRGGANIIETIEEAKAVVEISARQWPNSIQHTFVNDQSVFVADALGGLTSSVMTAIMLVMIIVVAVLGVRSALMIGIAIPSSFLIGFLLLSTFGYTLNMMVMFGLVLAVGMLVDGAIVIVEYADRRMGEGASRRNAYLEASKRMFWPVIASTATTLAAFVPFLFWQDLAGEFMKYLPLTLIFVLLSSLLVALVFLPVLGSLLGAPNWMKRKFGVKGKTDQPRTSEIEEIDPTTLQGPVGIFSRFISRLVQHPLLVMLGAAVVLFICMESFRLASPDVEFFIRNDSEEVMIIVQARGNLSELQKLEIVREVAARVDSHPAIEHIYLQTGPELSRNRSFPSDTIGQVGLDLVPYSERNHSSRVLAELRDMAGVIPGVLLEIRQREGGPPIGKDVQVELSAPSYEEMREAAIVVRNFVDTAHAMVAGREVLAFMEQEDSLPLPGVEWAIEVDRALAGRYGLSVSQAGAVLQFVTGGLLIDKYRPDDSEDEIDIRIRFPESARTILALDAVRVQTQQGSVPLSNFVVREARPQVDRITRRNGERIIEVKANGNNRIAGHEVSQDRAIALMREFLQSEALGENVTWVMRGADEETAAAASFFASAMTASLFLIAMILLLEFNSFYFAGLTLMAVIFSVFGVLLGIALSGQYVSVIMTGTGVVALAGIVVNNNIVLIDTFQHLRRKGLAVEDAVIRTVAQRARPVLLTTVTTIFGLLPMAFELDVNFAKGVITRGSTTSDWWVLLSSAVVYGLAFSTVLTLILTPVLLAAPSVISRRLGALIAKRDASMPAIAAPRVEPAPRQPKAAE